ncbi:cysteine proteinase [Conidiobolus coronatus NRRL 28638]|uniref:Cysteine proteinase n=1 Tax=Conidiobolus coronatus (strain ATCC 28846 / CBS 209.66 / NRRL 28638) TaxID=796925 RepID=A0A137PFI0_CONC2|nr:cysteine proteinase [Conidiobolus coronatus NRRL 28638]|eukprot:KXN73742.1 cysteine proteinase [Conidiobolus coronatus NRRL 28638]
MATQQYNTKLAYSKDQMYQYLKRINFLKMEKKVIRGHVNSIPYGNLSYIYYKRLLKLEGNYPYTTQVVSTDLQDIFKKMVLDERDGVCIEHNPLCAHMLMTLGFSAYLATSNCVDPKFWDQSDAGAILGRTPKPILMEEGLIQQVNPLTEYRISRASYPDSVVQSTNPKNLPWLLESKTKILPNKPQTRRNDWSPPTYITTSPAYLKDIRVMNDMSSGLKLEKILRSFILMTIETDKGYVTLRNKTLKIYTLNGVETIQLNSEKERRKAYLKYFNTKLPEDHKENLPSDICNYISFISADIKLKLLRNKTYNTIRYFSQKLI